MVGRVYYKIQRIGDSTAARRTEPTILGLKQLRFAREYYGGRTSAKESLMPILPLDYPEPFAATLGVMLYPGMDEDDQRNARAFAAQWIAEPLRRFHQAGHKLSYGPLARIAMDAQLTDLDDRWWGGTATGELFKTLWALFNTKPELTSWNNAVKIAERVAARSNAKGSRTDQWDARRRFLSVAHLWGAWCIREGRFGECPEVGYDGYHDFQFFLAEPKFFVTGGKHGDRRAQTANRSCPQTSGA
jgi:hypothetical protein